MTYKEGDNEMSLWNEEDGFYYDAIQFGPGDSHQLAIRSLVGLIPLYATLTLEPSVLNRLPGFKKRVEWFMDHRSEVAQRNMANMRSKYLCPVSINLLFIVLASGKGERRLLALASRERLLRILQRALDENEFLSEFGIRSLSVFFRCLPSSLNDNFQTFVIP